MRPDEAADPERAVDLLRGEREALLDVRPRRTRRPAQRGVVAPDGVDVQAGLRRGLGVADAVVVDPGEHVARLHLTGEEAAACTGHAEASALLVDEPDDRRSRDAA